jgi:L-2-hydroxyglutarate oxidase LhgO
MKNQIIDQIDVLIVGAGVIGLSIAKKLCLEGCQVLVIDKESSFGMGISSRNSEVIHAGLYFSPDMLKTKLCVDGKHQLYDYALKRNIAHKKCGKLLVASTIQEIEKLEHIKRNAEKCGIDDLTLLTKDQCTALEPDIHAVAGILSPSSGVIDTHVYMFSLLGDLENSGGQAVFNTKITAIKKILSGFEVTTNDDYKIQCTTLINAAGLGAMDIADMIDALDKKHIPKLVMAKGHYFSYSAKTNFKHLIYPLPFVGGLGVHLTIDMSGKVKFGPDVHFIEQEDYSINLELKGAFLKSIKHYFPKIDETKLRPDYAGIRPKLAKEGIDFDIQFPKNHAIEGLVNLFGIESPGLTSSLAIADYVAENII